MASVFQSFFRRKSTGNAAVLSPPENRLTASLSARNIYSQRILTFLNLYIPTIQPILPRDPGAFLSSMQRPYPLFLALLLLAVMILFSPASSWARKETAIKLTLEEAIERALQHNRQLRSSALDLNSRQVYLDEARDRFSVQISPLSSINYST
ncbi:MAG: hypothetical protein D3908_08460, partial [Candidatus Electrothrix sp. AUS4]|nr:hypothetical protein [Candidatus Electrothrix sp. AUS4]